MQISTFSQIGSHHLNHNEDYCSIHEIGSRRLLAVSDGCSMGTDSYFAATLLAKLLRKIAKATHYQDFRQPQKQNLPTLLEQIMATLFSNLQQIKNQWQLEREELLSTLMLAVVDPDLQTAEILTIGDGLICCNGQLVEYEQDNQPDYLGYHLHEEFATWYALQTQRLSFAQVEDLSLASDGIFTFQPFDTKNYETVQASDLIDYLLVDKKAELTEYTLHQKVQNIKSQYGLQTTDDLTVIRLRFAE